MSSVGTPLLWCSFSAIVIVMFTIDLTYQKRHHQYGMSIRQAAVWSIGWISLALLFAAGLWWYLTQTSGQSVAGDQAFAFLTGYIIEKALSIDNLFVWLMLFNYFAIPASLQRRVLVYGVLAAIVLRTLFIFTGSWLITQFEWLLYLFGGFLVITGIKMFVASEEQGNVGDKPIVRWLQKHLRLTSALENEHFCVRQNGLWYATPLLLVLIMVELSDVIFALDSIPAIFAVTTDPFIVLTSNLFAVMGLRAMYFLLVGMAEKLSLLKYGLAVILIFVGGKMLIEHFIHIPVVASLGTVVAILAITIIASLIYSQRKTAIEK